MDNEILNEKETLTLCNNNKSLAENLIDILKQDLPRQKQILLDAYASDNERMVRDIVHQILGSCSYISLPQIKKSALAFQTAIHNKTNNLEAFKEQLVEAIDTVIIQLSTHEN